MARRPPLAIRARRLLFSLTVSAFAAGVVASVAYAGSYLVFPVAGVEVEGARMYPESEAWEALPNRASLVTLDPATLRREVESNPWVKGARVSKNWDSGIVAVQVEERRAVLGGTLDGREVYYAADGAELPGPGGARLRKVGLDGGRLREVLGIVGDLEEGGVGFEAVEGVDAGGVTARVGGHRVLLGAGVEQAQLRALEGLMREHPDAPYFDLRSPGRVVVGEAGG